MNDLISISSIKRSTNSFKVCLILSDSLKNRPSFKFLQLRELTGNYSSEELLNHFGSFQILIKITKLYLRHQLDDPALHDLADVSINHSQCPLGPKLGTLTDRSPESAIVESKNYSKLNICIDIVSCE